MMTVSAVEKIAVPDNAKEKTVTWIYKRRPVQKEIHKILDEHRFSVLVAHRRFGKTVISVNQLILRAAKDQIQNGMYAYVAPYRNQAKAIAWAYLKRYTGCIPDRKINEQELSIVLPGNITIRIFGADNADALRGLYFDGIVLDEVAQMRREVWTEIIRPALSDRLGWALFIGTPKGSNLFHELYLHAETDTSGEWKALSYRVTDTDALPESEVEQLKKEMGENAFRQEYMCDFSASSDDVLITIDEAVAATRKVYQSNDYMSMPSVFGVDIGRFGDDRTVIFERRGLVAKTPYIMAKADNVTVAERIVTLYHELKPELIFIDAGQGQGVIDILHRRLNCVVEVPFGGSAIDNAKFLNRRAEMWYRMREWVRAGGKIPDVPDLITEISAPLYKFSSNGKIQLEAKEDIKERIGKSPDCFIAGTKIATPLGLRNIETIRVGDEVITPVGIRTVIRCWESEASHIITAVGLTGKPGHRVLTKDKGWLRLDSVSLTNDIESFNPWSLIKWNILNQLFTREEHISFKHQVDTILTETKMRSRDFFIDASGMTTLGIFLTACVSITKTMIGLITGWKTWRSCQQESMPHYILKSVTKKICKSINAVWLKLEKRLKNGMDRKKKNLPVINAEQNAAQETALTKTETVYNLTLDRDNVYYANGILVENCADALALTFAEHVLPSITNRQMYVDRSENLLERYDDYGPQRYADGMHVSIFQ